MKNVLILLGICVLLGGCRDTTTFESPSSTSLDVVSQSKAVPRPFKGTWSTTFTPPGEGIPGCDGNEDTGVFIINGIGTATHLGKSISVSESESDFVTQCGHSVTYSAIGDQFEFDFTGTVSPPDADLNITFSGEWTVTGGTGKFSNAQGGGTYQGRGNLIAGAGKVTNIGTLIY
jgi:hypothetical protein